MPFTFAHPAAVLPLRRARLVFSALVVGSMAPDFDYFFRVTGLGRTSHTWPGVITFTFPVAVAVLIAFHALVKWPTICLLPHALKARVIGPARGFHCWPPARLFLILVSLAIGMATHLLWDGFTHEHGWAVLRWPAFLAVVALPHVHKPMYILLQYGGTLFGALALVVCFVRWYKRAPQEDDLPAQMSPAMSGTILLAMVATAVAVGFLRGSAGPALLARSLSLKLQFLVGFAINATRVVAIELFGFSLIWRIFLVRSQ